MPRCHHCAALAVQPTGSWPPVAAGGGAGPCPATAASVT